MLVRLIRNLRQQPKAVRNQVAFWLAASFTGVVALLWLTTQGVAVTTTLSSSDEVAPVSESSSLREIVSEFRQDISSVSRDPQPAAVIEAATTTASSVITPPVRRTVQIATFTASTTN